MQRRLFSALQMCAHERHVKELDPQFEQLIDVTLLREYVRVLDSLFRDPDGSLEEKRWEVSDDATPLKTFH